jgi:hypothetical protein
VAPEIEGDFDSLKQDRHCVRYELKKLSSAATAVPVVEERKLGFVTPYEAATEGIRCMFW